MTHDTSGITFAPAADSSPARVGDGWASSGLAGHDVLAAEVVRLAVSLIDADPNQPRKTFCETGLRELGQTMAGGQIDAVHVRRNGLRYLLVHGQRRWMAAKVMGLETISAIILAGEAPDEAARLEAQLVSNIQREALNPIDLAVAIDRLIRLTGKPAGAVAARLGKSPSHVSKLITLLLLPAEVQERVAHGELALSTAYELAKVADAAERTRLTEAATSGSLTRDAVIAETKALAKARKPRKQSQRRATRVVFRLDRQRTVAISGPELSLSYAVNWIGELLSVLTSANAGGLALADVAKSLSGKLR